MRTKFLLYILFTLLVAAGTYAQQTTVMTYNIRYDNPEDSINAWKNRKDKLCRQVLRENPDLLGVQEALNNQVKDLDSMLQGYSHTGVGREDGKEKGEYSALFYKTSRYEFQDGGNFWLSTTPEIPGSIGWDAACTRIVSWVKLKDKSTGSTVCFFNTHFDHMGLHARKNSARLLKRKIKSIAKGIPIILTGDFNCNLKSKPMKILGKGRLKLKDSRNTLRINTEPFFTYSTFFVNGKHGEIIDHIFTNNSFKVNAYKVLTDHEDGHYFSDHLPVIAIISPKK